MYWKDVIKNSPKPWVITFICTGNIMRSPYAEFISRKVYLDLKNQQSGIEGIVFKSGAVTHQNNTIHPLSEKYLLEEGIRKEIISIHQPRLIDNYIKYFKESNLFIGMTNKHKRILTKKGYKHSYLLSEVADKGREEILDPYFNPEKDKDIYLKLKLYTKIFVNELVKL